MGQIGNTKTKRFDNRAASNRNMSVIISDKTLRQETMMYMTILSNMSPFVSFSAESNFMIKDLIDCCSWFDFNPPSTTQYSGVQGTNNMASVADHRSTWQPANSTVDCAEARCSHDATRLMVSGIHFGWKINKSSAFFISYIVSVWSLERV